MEKHQTLDLSSVSYLALHQVLHRQSYETADMIAMQIIPLNHLKLKQSTKHLLYTLASSTSCLILT